MVEESSSKRSLLPAFFVLGLMGLSSLAAVVGALTLFTPPYSSTAWLSAGAAVLLPIVLATWGAFGLKRLGASPMGRIAGGVLILLLLQASLHAVLIKVFLFTEVEYVRVIAHALKPLGSLPVVTPWLEEVGGVSNEPWPDPGAEPSTNVPTSTSVDASIATDARAPEDVGSAPEAPDATPKHADAASENPDAAQDTRPIEVVLEPSNRAAEPLDTRAPEDLSAIFTSIRSKDPAVHRPAFETLKSNYSKAAAFAPALLGLLAEGTSGLEPLEPIRNGSLAHRAAALIERHAIAASPAIARGLADPEASTRRAAARALAWVRGDVADAATGRALSDADPETRALAAAALSPRLAVQQSTRLSALLSDREPRVRKAVLFALAKGQPKDAAAILEKWLSESEATTRIAAAEVVRRVPGVVSPKLVLAAFQKETDTAVRGALADALGAVGGADAFISLSAALHGELGYHRSVALALARLGHPDAAPRLIEELEDPDRRTHAVEALGILGDVRARALVEAALLDADPAHRAAAALALGKIAGLAAKDLLTKRVQDTDPEVARAAIFALSELRDPSVDATLTSLRKKVKPAIASAVDEAFASRER